MNETRKQIVELIEFYMDKTLVRGCLYIIPQLKGIDDSIKTINIDKVTDNSFEGVKILGNYDITAVLKYIEQGSYYALLKIFITRDLKEIILEEGEDTREEVYYEPVPHYIPNKPLHLYTEQEEKDLLELLKKLGK